APCRPRMKRSAASKLLGRRGRRLPFPMVCCICGTIRKSSVLMFANSPRKPCASAGANNTLKCAVATVAVTISCQLVLADAPRLEIRQLTTGPQHYFFGYIGHVQNVPWNGSDRYIVALRTSVRDHLPDGSEPAEIVLLDTENNYVPRVVDRSRAWNPQQGTMLYWNPQAQETQFFFNDRDPASNKIFCVLCDVSRDGSARRVREFRFEDTPVGNSGVMQRGGKFLAINYGRMARLRRVTGYAGAFDWTDDLLHPADDGVFCIDVASGKKQILV